MLDFLAHGIHALHIKIQVGNILELLQNGNQLLLAAPSQADIRIPGGVPLFCPGCETGPATGRWRTPFPGCRFSAGSSPALPADCPGMRASVSHPRIQACHFPHPLLSARTDCPYHRTSCFPCADTRTGTSLRADRPPPRHRRKNHPSPAAAAGHSDRRCVHCSNAGPGNPATTCRVRPASAVQRS